MHLVSDILQILILLDISVLSANRTSDLLVDLGFLLQELGLLVILDDGHFILNVLLVHKDVILLLIEHHVLVVFIHHLVYLVVLLVEHVVQPFVIVLLFLLQLKILHCDFLLVVVLVQLLSVLL